MKRLQILDDDGNLIAPDLEPKIGKKELKRALETMIQVRLLDEKGIRLQRQGKVTFHIFTKGQEAHVAAAVALQDEDWVYPAYREHGIALYRGFSLEDLVNHLFANVKDKEKGRRLPGLFGSKKHNFVNPSAPIGTQIIQAAGTAYAMKLKGEPNVTAVFFGDGATSSNDFHSGLNFGGVTKSPVIFVCQNNQWAISVPFEKQTAAKQIVDRAPGYGIEGIQIDGNDFLAFYTAIQQARERALRGEGPTLIESITYRVTPHTSSDDPKVYRSEDEVKQWEKKDPIKRFKNYLINKGVIKEADYEKMVNSTSELLDKLIDEAEKLPKPSLSTLFDDVFEEIPPFLQEEKEELLNFYKEA
ncbi:MAG: pyruvate dehydrogenase (acetyl-transferring) E1 component subunit alpha [Methanobacteriota archaeon]|nr:MAG: pyruvate dehydrogenase (acetyl-transferring) E1 component subunit alpha [Euryarchaeota archaeon]